MANQTINQTTTQRTELPEWYTQYLQNVMGRAVGAAGEEYIPYGGDRVSGFVPAQGELFRGVSNMQGMLTGVGNQALAGTEAAGNVNSAAAGAGQFGQAEGIYGRVAGSNTAGISDPYVRQGTGYLQQAASGSALDQANPYIRQSVAPQGLAAASPYLQAAGTSFPGAVDAYMNPYNRLVTDEIARLGARNLGENLLPQISDQFVRAGQYGSAQQRDVVGRALRDTQEGILSQQANVLQQGYGQAGQLYGQDASRYAQLAGTAGGLGTSQQQLLQQAGSTLGNLSATDLSRLAAAGVNIGNLGLGQAGVAGSDYSRQLAAAQGIQGIGQSLIDASQVDAARRLQAAGQTMDIGTALQNSRVQQLGLLDQVGAMQQNQNQRILDTQYGDFLEQRNYPWQQIGNLSNVIQGVPMPTSQTGSSTTTQPGPSTLSQVGGLGAGILGLTGALNKAQGGAVRAPRARTVKYKRSHSYGNVPRRGLSFNEAA